MTYVYIVSSSEEGSLSAADLKRQNTTPLGEVNHWRSSLLQTQGSWQTLKTKKHLRDAKAWKLQRRPECPAVHCESWDTQAAPAQFIVLKVVKVMNLLHTHLHFIFSVCGRLCGRAGAIRVCVDFS